LVTGGDDDKLVRWTLATDNRDSLRGFSQTVSTLASSANGAFTAAGFQDGTIRLWNQSKDPSRLQPAMTLRSGNGRITALKFSSNARTLVSVAENSRVVTWDLDWNADAGRERADASTGLTVSAAAFSSDGRRLAAGDGLGTIRVWKCE
jgi:WD40 repeat protein